MQNVLCCGHLIVYCFPCGPTECFVFYIPLSSCSVLDPTLTSSKNLLYLTASVPSTCHTSSLREDRIGCDIPSVWSALPPFTSICPVNSLFRFQVKGHFLREAFLNSVFDNGSLFHTLILLCSFFL